MWNMRQYMKMKMTSKYMERMELKKLKELFEVLDYISDLCDDIDTSTDGILDQIRLTANGELAELEELIIELEKK